jgi:hypothetical protein
MARHIIKILDPKRHTAQWSTRLTRPDCITLSLGYRQRLVGIDFNERLDRIFFLLDTFEKMLYHGNRMQASCLHRGVQLVNTEVRYLVRRGDHTYSSPSS